ncbi:MAG: metal ABC transporter permease [Porticoccaceae bacterium]|nr:metal ABC transporter permease [Porticoccaceae bacterium]
MTSLMVIFEPFTFVFMQQAFVIAILVAIPTAILSCFLVLKGWSLMGDAISHSILPGVVLAYILGFPFIIGAFFAGIFCATATGFISNNSRLKEDTAMGVVFSSMFALGIVMMTKVDSSIHLDHILFGDILGISWGDVMQAGLMSAIVIVVILAKGKDLLVFVFDHQHANVIGLSVGLLHYGLLSVLSLTIVSALKAVGMILVIALLIAPGAIAHLVTNEFKHMLRLSIVVSVICSILGVYASFFIDSAPAPTITVLLSIAFIGVFVLTTRKAKVNSLQQPQSTG